MTDSRSSEDTNACVELLDVSSGTHADEGTTALIEQIDREAIALSAVLQKYDVVSADQDHGYIIMAERGKTPTVVRGEAPTGELGSSSPSPWTSWTREEHVPELRGRDGLTKYYRMKRNDGIVRGSLRALKTSLLAAHWFVKAGSDSTADKNIAKFVEDNLFERLNVSWPVLLQDVLLCAEYGYIPFEKVYEEPRLEGAKFVQRLRKLAPRHPIDVQSWEYDNNGGPNGIVMESNLESPTSQGVYIPIKKLAIFTLEPEAGDLSGISILRSAYKHWYFKDTLYKIDAIQKERHGIGIPIIKLPMGYTPADRAAAEELGRNLRTNERAHVVLPPNWELIFAKVEGQLVDCMKSVEHHDMAIMANVLGAWLKDASVKSDSIDMFLKSTRYIAAVVADIFNRHVIRELVDYNFKMADNRSYPKLMCRRIGEWEDLRTQSFAIRNHVGAGVIEPDDEMERVIREELDLPPKDVATARRQITQPAGTNDGEDPADPADPPKQDGAKAGGSRQRPVPPIGAGRANAGTDRSGG